MKILVTGGTGFIGSHVVNQFLKEGHEVTTYDAGLVYTDPSQTFLENLAYRKRLRKNVRREFRGYTMDWMRLCYALRDAQPDRIVHLAALPIANIAQRNPEECFKHIVGGTVNLLHTLQSVGFTGHLVYVSSSMVYGDFESTPILESARLSPKGAYAGAKLAGEVLVRAYCQTGYYTACVVRPSAVYGPGDNNHRVVQKFLEAAFRGKPITVYNGNDMVMDFTYVTDIARGIYLAATRKESPGRIFNITRGEGRTLSTLVDIIKEHFPDSVVTELTDYTTFRSRRGALDISEAKLYLEYTPTMDLEHGVQEYISHMRTNNPSLKEAK